MATTADVARSVGKLARLYRNELDADTIEFYAEVLLRRMTPEQACDAIAKWAEAEPRWPSPGQIISLVHPKAEAKDEAAELAQRLRVAISRHGYTWESTHRYDGHASIDDAIRSELGDAALSLVQRCGGWSAFCREWGGEDGDTSARAQLRGLCEASLKNTAASPALALPAKRTPGIEHAGAILGGFIPKRIT